VTRMAGANAYAAKLATSPKTTAYAVSNGRPRRDGYHTCDDAAPPYWTLQICESITFEAMMLLCVHQPLDIVSLLRSMRRASRRDLGDGDVEGALPTL
jgi:hypothetical protein